MKNIIIFGSTSAIAEEIAKIYAKEKSNLYLFARNTAKLELIQQDLLVRGANKVNIDKFDALDFSSHKALIEKAFNFFEQVDICIIAHGSLPNQEQCQLDASMAINEINTNGSSVISLLTHIANKMEQQKSGNITVITSVAGDRGRQSNYVYGAAKGMVSTFLQGLGQHLHKSGIHVLDIKPGFVDTPMTKEFKKGILWSKPDKVAEMIFRKITNKNTQSYSPFFWFPIMLIIKLIPSSIFNKVKL